MFKNNNKRNLVKTFDLTKSEIEKFYCGCGEVTICIDEKDKIVDCFYHEIKEESVFNDEVEYEKKVFPFKKSLEGFFSCHQFCEC